MKTCPATGKICHRNKGDALRSIIRKSKVKHSGAYICPECGYWHLTSNSQNRGSYRKHNKIKNEKREDF